MSNQFESLIEKTDSVSNFVCCKGCNDCCFNSPVFVLPSEVKRLKALGVPLTKLEKIFYIHREKKECPMLNKSTKLCEIYDDRPLCCRMFPFDIFSRNGLLEWGIYNFCPTEKQGLQDRILITLVLRQLEKYLTPEILRYFKSEDFVSQKYEFLDKNRKNYQILFPLKCNNV
jgi:Fe-S-cluster containining protein